MKALIIVLLVVLIIGAAPAFAAVVTVHDQTVVRGDHSAKVLLNLSKQNKDVRMYKIDEKILNKVNSGVRTHNAENLAVFKPIVKFDTTGVVMQSTSYNCGPAALATVLNNLGINTTEQELAVLAGTDESGTTMYGLMQAVQAKGVNVIGIRLSVTELKKNDIVVLIINGMDHYSVINEITCYGVKLSDPRLGNIIMPKKEFKKIYSGNALVINNLNLSLMNLSNLTENKTSINSSNLQLNDKLLKNKDMKSFKSNLNRHCNHTLLGFC